MKGFLIITLLVATMLTCMSAFGAEFSIGIMIGTPPPPPVVRIMPACPGPEFVWIAGYWYPAGSYYRWHDGYWTQPPYRMARWVGPSYDGQRYYSGYWERGRAWNTHERNWNRNRNHRGRGHR
jgi:hypothetical protein